MKKNRPVGAVSGFLALTENETNQNMRPKWQKECKTLFICPTCDRVYQTMYGFLYDKETKRPKPTKWEEYLTDFPKLQEKRVCEECK